MKTLLAKQSNYQWVQYKLKVFPRRINSQWYWPGQTVYRRFMLSPGGGFWRYADEFDILSEK